MANTLDQVRTMFNALCILDAIDRTRGELAWSTSSKAASYLNRRWLLDSEPQWNGGAVASYVKTMAVRGLVKATNPPRNPRAPITTKDFVSSYTAANAIWITDVGYERLKLFREALMQ